MVTGSNWSCTSNDGAADTTSVLGVIGDDVAANAGFKKVLRNIKWGPRKKRLTVLYHQRYPAGLHARGPQSQGISK